MSMAIIKNKQFISEHHIVAPWQYYSAKFIASDKLIKIKLSFENFKKYNFFKKKQFIYLKIQLLGIVVGFANFALDTGVAEIGFY